MMPMADIFAPDVNFTSQRSVYPTAPGGSVASAGTALNLNTNMNVPDPSSGTVGIATIAGTPGSSGSKHTLSYWVGLLVFLLAMVFIARKAGGEEDFKNIRPTFYNFMTITLTAIVGIVGMKTIAAKFRVPGASDVILAA